jgi:hypothetical protein
LSSPTPSFIDQVAFSRKVAADSEFRELRVGRFERLRGSGHRLIMNHEIAADPPIGVAVDDEIQAGIDRYGP